MPGKLDIEFTPDLIEKGEILNTLAHLGNLMGVEQTDVLNSCVLRHSKDPSTHITECAQQYKYVLFSLPKQHYHLTSKGWLFLAAYLENTVSFIKENVTKYEQEIKDFYDWLKENKKCQS